MIIHFITIALRNLTRKRLLSFIRIFGLSLGIAAFILIVKYVHYEKHWDKFNKNYDRIYRIQRHKKTDKTQVSSKTSVPLSAYIMLNIPEIEKVVTIKEFGNELLSPSPGITFYETEGIFAPSAIFSIFSFELLEGNQNNVLDRSNSIVLSESMARKYFPDDKNSIGKTIFDKQKNALIVTGIMKDVPPNSHIRPYYLRSITERLSSNFDTWDNNSYQNYVLLKAGTDADKIDQQIKTIYDNNIEENKDNLYLHPLKKLHLEPDKSGDFKSVVFFISLLGLLIFTLALVNFMNLSTACLSTRSAEIGIRKTNGSGKKTIVFQFLSESVIISIISFFIALIPTFLCLPWYNRIVNREITLSFSDDAGLFLFVLGVSVISGILAGAYPAVVVSSLNPVKVFKNKNILQNKRRHLSAMKSMVYIQFVLSSILIAGSLWIYKQVNFMLTKELGFEKTALLHCKVDAANINKTYMSLRNEILSQPGIVNMALSYSTPMHNSWGMDISYEGGQVNEYTEIWYNKISPDFIDTYGMKIVNGRNFSYDYANDYYNCLINETAVRWFGWKDPLGKWIEVDGSKRYVIGVVKDFHQEDVHNPIEPYVALLHDGNLNRQNCYTFLINPNSIKNSINHIEKVFNNSFPNSLFQVFAFDDDADRVDIKIWSKIRDTFAFFSIVAVIIAIVGIFGLVVFSTQRKVKEIGVRKIQGARVIQVFVLVIQEFIVLLLIANLTVFPVFPALVRYSPGVFKYHATVWDILTVVALTLCIVFIASGYLAYKAATRNPVESLRYE